MARRKSTRNSTRTVKSGNTIKTTTTRGGRTTTTTKTVHGQDVKGKPLDVETVVESSGGEERGAMSPGEHFLTMLLLLALLGVYLNYRTTVTAFWTRYVASPSPRAPLAVNPTTAATGQQVVTP